MIALWLALQYVPGPYEAEPWLFRVNGGAFGRLSFPVGAVEDVDITDAGEVIFLGDKLRYLDLFEPGLGIGLEADVAFTTPSRPGTPLHRQMPAIGMYGALQVDVFDGRSDRDELGNRIRPDDLRISSGVVGVKVAGTVHDRHFGELRLGAGASRYDEVEARFTSRTGTSVRAVLFEESSAFLLEFRMRYGYRAGPLAIVAGLGLRANLGPDEGAGAGPSIDPGPLWLPELDLGLQLGF